MKKFKHIPTGDIWTECKAPAYIGLICNKLGDKLPLIYTAGKDWEQLCPKCQDKGYLGFEYNRVACECMIKNQKKKEYEILTFKGRDSLTFRVGDRFHSGVLRFTEEQLLSMPHWKIFSIKRLSDGEVFTIGDKITGPFSIDENPKSGPGYTYIKSFELNNDDIWINISTGVFILKAV